MLRATKGPLEDPGAGGILEADVQVPTQGWDAGELAFDSTQLPYQNCCRQQTQVAARFLLNLLFEPLGIFNPTGHHHDDA